MAKPKQYYERLKYIRVVRRTNLPQPFLTAIYGALKKAGDPLRLKLKVAEARTVDRSCYNNARHANNPAQLVFPPGPVGITRNVEQ